MTDIPEDIRAAALKWLYEPVADDAGNNLRYFVGVSYQHKAVEAIARAIQEERERCAQIAELRLTESLTQRHMVDLPPFLAKYDGDFIRAIAAAIRSPEAGE